MTKYILVGGYVNNALDEGKAFYEELVNGIDKKPVKILDCVFARPVDSWDDCINKDNFFFSKFIKNFELELADPIRFTEQVKNSDVIFLRGGFTSALMDLLSKDMSWIKEIEGKVIAGTSAGGEVIAKYYHVLSSSRTGDGLGLLPIKFIPHWKSEHFDGEKQNIDFDKSLKELKEYKEELPVYTLKEGEFKVFVQ